jgi:hypothetical protein
MESGKRGSRARASEPNTNNPGTCGRVLSTQIVYRGDRLSAPACRLCDADRCGPAQAGRDRRARRDRSFLRPCWKKSVPSPKNCRPWVCSEYLVFPCGLRLPVPARQTGGLCGKTETFGFNLVTAFPWAKVPASRTLPEGRGGVKRNCARRPIGSAGQTCRRGNPRACGNGQEGSQGGRCFLR